MDFEHFSFQRPPVDTEQFYKEFASNLDQFNLKENDDEFEAIDDNDDVERRKPTTPIEHALRKAPKTIQEIKALIHERLQIRADIKLVSTSDQQELSRTLMSELSAVWPEMRNQAPDPFLSKEDNKELERRVAVTVVNVIERLYKEYIDKLQDANAKKIFNAASNISRFKTQLSFDANKSLNILNIRRKLAKILRHPLEEDDNPSEDSFVLKVKEKLSESSQKSKGSIVKKLQMTRELAKKLYHESELDDLRTKMPVLNKDDFILPRPSSFTTAKGSSFRETIPEGELSENENQEIESKKESQMIDKKPTQRHNGLQRSNSLPMVDTAKMFLEELEITQEEVSKKRKTSVLKLPVKSEGENEEEVIDKQQENTNLRHDLENLLQGNYTAKETVNKSKQVDLSESMPPLLQAMPVYSRRPIKNETGAGDADQSESSLASTVATADAFNSLINEEDDNERSEQLPPTQPSVVTTKLPNKVFARTSNVRVSNRQNVSNITLNRHKTIYNNFKAEIDDVTVKQLDRNLFAGEEIKEVYEEVIKTINKVHLQFDKDDFIIKCPQSLDLFDLFASNLLQNTKSNKIFNQEISGCDAPPWSSQGADDWRNSPKFGGLGRQEILELKANAPKDLIMQDNSYDKAVERKPTKSYAAWLAWWRSTINSEDYYKYISVKDNDFLSKVFHLYDSGDDDDDADLSQNSTVENPEELARRKLMQERLNELQAKKDEYEAGLWNVNTVLLGGLGKTPLLEQEPIASSPENDKKHSLTIPGQRLLSSQSTKSRLKSSLTLKSSKASSGTGIQLNEDQGSENLHAPEITIQDRLERIWNRLRMPENLRLDMAIKYSLDKNTANLSQAISYWESAVDKIVEREELIAILEKFERIASDPNRFFQKGSQGSSLNRLDESKSRKIIHKRLNQLDISAKKAVLAVQSILKETVTYEGRHYLDKLARDKTEMLYWLQQERRLASLEKDQNFVEHREKISELPPISTLTLL